MDGLKISVCIIILINLIFAEEIKSDSSLNLLNSLKRQKLFYSSTSENWIPPSLPSESGCIGVGCCLMPLSGFLIMKEAFKKEAPPESLRQSPQPKFSIGISYSPGIAYAGMLGRSLETGEMDPFHDLYFNNTLEIDCKYYLNSYWGLSLCGGYMWTHLEERGIWLIAPEHWKSGNSFVWDIWNYYGVCRLLHNFLHVSISEGLEYYFSTGKDYEEWIRADTIKTFIGTTHNKGLGCIVSVGFEKPIFSKVSWNSYFVLRYGGARSYKQETEQEDVVWWKPVDFTFTGIYVKIGINYVFYE
ncbi:MAG: hypothetical protein ABIL40_02325 [candidate division WOR-3 bacterium]